MTPEDRQMVFFEPCKTKEELQWFMKAFLNVDLPDRIIDEDSTSSPVDFIWDVYKCMLTGKGPTRHVVAAARNSAKTLAAVIVRFFGMVHFRRDGTHLAANLEQSKSASRYLNRFLSGPDIAPFVVKNNTREIELANLPANSYTKRNISVLQVAVATLGGVNSQRGSLNTRDELDLVPQTILSEASFQADPTQDEHMFDPIEINLSSRKSNSGPIQSLLDEAEDGKTPTLQAHKWSNADWMKKCPSDIAQTDKPVNAWINVENLKTIWDINDYNALAGAEQALMKEVRAYQGCVSCPAFIVCQGRSVNQTGTQKMLRTREFVATVLQSVKDPEKIIAQSLNWRPETSAVVFRVFNKRRHFLGAISAWYWLFGEFYNPNKWPKERLIEAMSSGKISILAEITPTKKAIYNKLIEDGWTVTYGIDWGYSPDPAVCVVVAYHKRKKRAFILNTDQALNHSNDDWAEYVKTEVYPLYPCEFVAPDIEDKGTPVHFRKRGMACLDKKPSRIETGVSQIRGLLWNVAEQRENFAILDDGDLGNNKWVAECFEKWTYLKTAMGYQYGKFDTNSEYTHPLDAIRYALHPFIDVTEAKIAAKQPKTENQAIVAAASGNKEAAKEIQDKVIEQGAKAALERHFKEEFGLEGVFKTEEKQKSPEKKSGHGLKFRF